MRKKILTVLAPVLAIMAFAVVPAMAQAEEIQGSEFTASSSNLVTNFGERTIECASSTLQLQKVSGNQAVVIGGAFLGAGGSLHCATNNSGESAIIQTNAATVGWYFHTSGDLQHATLQGGAAAISFTAHFYTVPGQSLIESCTFTATGAIPLAYHTSGVANPVITIEAGATFTSSCGEAELSGEFSTAGVTLD